MGKMPTITPACIRFEQEHDPVLTTKLCTACGESRTLSEFYRNMNSLDYRRSECKRCTNKRQNNLDENGYKRKLFAGKKSHARQVEMKFLLQFDDVEWPTHCPILDTELIYAPRTQERPLSQVPSFDRIDSSRGYVPGNVKIISVQANTLKSNTSVSQLKKLLAYMEANPDETHNTRQTNDTVSRVDTDSAIHRNIARKTMQVTRKPR